MVLILPVARIACIAAGQPAVQAVAIIPATILLQEDAAHRRHRAQLRRRGVANRLSEYGVGWMCSGELERLALQRSERRQSTDLQPAIGAERDSAHLPHWLQI